MTVFAREEARVSLEARIAKELCSAALVIPMCCTVTTRRRLWVTACVSKRVGTLPSGAPPASDVLTLSGRTRGFPLACSTNAYGSRSDF